MATKNTSVTLPPKVWGLPAFEVSGYDHTGVTMVPVVTNQTGNAWYVAHDQATAAADTSEDLCALFGLIGTGVIYRTMMSVRSPDGDTISIDLYRDGVFSETLGTYSDTEWRLIDLGDIRFPQEDAFAVVPWTIRLSGGLAHAAFMYLMPRALYYEGESAVGADATTDTVSYAFAGETAFRAAPWPAGVESIMFGPVTPTIAPTGVEEFVQIVGIWKGTSAYPSGAGGPNWDGYLAKSPIIYIFADGATPTSPPTLSLSEIMSPGAFGKAFQDQFAPYAMVEGMGVANDIFGDGARLFNRGVLLTQGVEIDFRHVDTGLPYSDGDDADQHLDAVMFARPIDNPYGIAGCSDVDVGDTLTISWAHVEPDRVVSYDIVVFDTSDWSTASTDTNVTSPFDYDTTGLAGATTFRLVVRAIYDDGSFGYDDCEFTTGVVSYGPLSLNKSVSL